MANYDASRHVVDGSLTAIIPVHDINGRHGTSTAGLIIQPVTLAYTSINGLPVLRGRLPDLAWLGDTELAPHALGFMALGRVTAEIMFHEPIDPADFPDRKALARHCHDIIAAGYRQLMRGG